MTHTDTDAWTHRHTQKRTDTDTDTWTHRHTQTHADTQTHTHGYRDIPSCVEGHAHSTFHICVCLKHFTFRRAAEFQISEGCSVLKRVAVAFHAKCFTQTQTQRHTKTHRYMQTQTHGHTVGGGTDILKRKLCVKSSAQSSPLV